MVNGGCVGAGCSLKRFESSVLGFWCSVFILKYINVQYQDSSGVSLFVHRKIKEVWVQKALHTIDGLPCVAYLQVTHTQTKILSNRDVLFKYLNKNLVFVATVSPRASGLVGAAIPEDSTLVAYLIDTVSGRILHRVSHPNMQGPVHAVSNTHICTFSTPWHLEDHCRSCVCWISYPESFKDYCHLVFSVHYLQIKNLGLNGLVSFLQCTPSCRLWVKIGLFITISTCVNIAMKCLCWSFMISLDWYSSHPRSWKCQYS